MKRKIISLLCILVLICTAFAWIVPVHASFDDNKVIISESDIPLALWYSEEAPQINEYNGYRDYDAPGGEDVSWQEWSLPLGNGYFGANVFGRTETERIQISEKTLANKYMDINGVSYGGMNNFSETFIDFGHTNSAVTDYKRYLDIKTAISGVEYAYGGVKYSREYFTSYPDKALVIKLDADTAGALSFTLRPTVPYEQSYMAKEGDTMGKTGEVISSVSNGVGYIELSGKLEYYDVDFLGIYKVYTDGGTVTASTAKNTYKDTDGTEITDTDGTIVVDGAKSAYIVVTLGTDYELSSETFTAPDKEKPTFDTDLNDTRVKVEGDMNKIDAKIAGKSFNDAYNTLKDSHLADYTELFGRATLDLGCNSADFNIPTAKLLESYKNGYKSVYLETLMFQYGRYTLIASSRSGALPAHLQGAWNPYNTAPWGSGYWHNINVQMNYWPAFSTNLTETFEAYVEHNMAFLAAAEAKADSEIQKNNPDAYGKDGGNGWIIGMSSFPYRLSLDASVGNLGFTTQMFWDYYQYTKDETILKETVYPILLSAARYITKCVELDENGNYLIQNCDSPEVFHNGVWYYTDGTTYAQTFAYLNNYHVLELAKEIGIELDKLDTLVAEGTLSSDDRAILSTILEQIDKYDPIQIGLSGQIKEFREEDFYSSIGDDPNHRHAAHLSALYPGNIINSSTEAWLDAAEVALYGRRLSTAVSWSYAYKSGLYARVKDAEAARDMIDDLLSNDTFANLYTSGWDIYQTDATYGTTAAMAEMLMQSNSGYIEMLPALPENWSTGSFTGLVAIGNFEVSAAWENGLAKTFNITSKSGGTASVYYPSITNAYVVDSDGNKVNYTANGNNLISFETEVGKTYIIYGFTAVESPDAPENLVATKNANGSVNLTWSANPNVNSYNVYVAVDNAPSYTLVGTTSGSSFVYSPSENEKDLRTTYAVTAVGSAESKRTLAYTYSDEVIETPYGTVTAARVEGEAFIMFAKALGETEYQFLGTGDNIVDAFDKARIQLKGGAEYYQGGTIALYLLKDCTATGTASGAGWNAAPQIDGTVIVDLGGHKLTSTAPRLIGFEAKTSNNGYEYVTNFEFKNGKICTSKPLVEFLGNSGIYTGTKVANISFEGITFTPNGSSGFTLFKARGSYTSTQKAEFNVNFTDCALNYSGLSNMVLLDDTCAAGTVDCNISINGGTIKAKSFNDFTINKGFADEDSLIFKKGSNGSRTEITVSYTSTAPTLTFNTDEGVKHLASAGIDNTTAEASRTVTYRLSSIETPYGYIPENQRDTTFSLFYNGLHINSFNNYANAEVRIKELLYPNSSGIYLGETLTLYMRKDYTHTAAPYGNFAQKDGTFVLDLGGNTLTLMINSLFDVVGKAVNSTVLKTTYVVVKNGTILVGESPIMNVNSKGTSGNFGYDGTKPFSFIYENVTFDKNPTVSTYTPLISVSKFDETSFKNVYIYAEFNNCSFVSDNSLLFDLSVSNYIDTDIIIKGGNLTANTIGEYALLKGSDINDTLSFVKNDEGNYMTLTMPNNAPTPNATFNNGELYFAKISEGNVTSIYELTEEAQIYYVPKMSITLESQLVMNVYIPVDYTQKFIFDGVIYDDFTNLTKVSTSGNEYYRLTVSLPSGEAARDIKLVASVDDGVNFAVVTFTFSIPKYATKVIANSDASSSEITLIKDILAYIRAAYAYFDPNDTDTVSAIDSIIGKNYNLTSPYTPAESKNPNGFKSVTFALTSTPAIKFYLNDGTDASKYAFKINGKNVSFTAETDSDGSYVKMDIYAFAMCEDVECFFDGKSAGSYNIASYYEWAKTQNNSALVTLVERFAKYSESAKAYKNSSVVQINYVDESGNSLAASKTVRVSRNEKISVVSPAINGYYTRDVYLNVSLSDSSVINVTYKPIPSNIDTNYVNEILANIVCWGDSITAGSGKNELTVANQYGIDLVALGSEVGGASYVTVLRNLIKSRIYSAISVRGCGVGGESTATIASRADTDTYYLYFDGAVTISSSAVTVPLAHYTSGGRVGILRQGDASEINPVTVVGKDAGGNEISVTGALSLSLTPDAPAGTDIRICDAKYLQYTFTRDDGKTNTLNFVSGARVITKASYLYDGRTCIIFMGENGGYKDTAELIKQQEEMLAACGNPEYFLIISTTSGSYDSRTEVRNALTQRWGDHYINMGDELNSSSNSYKFAGFSEEAIISVQDNILNGTVSKLLIKDSCHPNAVGYAVIGNIIFERLFKLGAFDELLDYYDRLNTVTTETFEFNGYTATVIRPANPNGKWIWKTEFLTAFDKAERALLDEGYTRVYYSISNKYGNPEAVSLMESFYHEVTERYDLDGKCILFGFSRGGLYAFNFALECPEYVDKIYLDAPVLDLKTWPTKSKNPGEFKGMLASYGLTEEEFASFKGSPVDKLEEFFKLGIPLLVVAGDSDATVPFEENAGRLIEYANANGYNITYVVEAGKDHHPHSLTDVTLIVDFCKRGTYENAVSNPLAKEDFLGKTITFLGDSITYGVGASSTANRYSSQVASSLGMTEINMGISGTVMCTGGHRTSRLDDIQNISLDSDYVGILLGINDFDQCRNNGTSKYYALGEFGTSDTTTIYGALDKMCKDLVTRFGSTDTKLFLMTPVVTSWNNSVSGVRDWDQNKVNACGYTLRELCDAIIEVATYYGIVTLDLNDVCEMGASDFSDGIHPNDSGAKKMADAIEAFLLANYSFE